MEIYISSWSTSPCGPTKTGGSHWWPLRNLLEDSRYDTGKIPNFSETLKWTSLI